MTALPHEYRGRSATLEDVPAIVALEAAYDTATVGRPYITEVWIKEDFRRPRFDPSRDAWVVTNGDSVVGYGYTYEEQVGAEIESVARVHPDHWGRGIGAALVGLMEERGREHAARAPGRSIRFLNVVTTLDAAAVSLLEGRGYAVDRHFWHMAIELAEPRPAVSAPSGIVIRPYESSDAAAVHGLIEEAFRDHYQYAPTSFDEWSKVFDEPWHDSGLWLVATDGDGIVGALLARVMGEEGWVNDLGVLGHARGRGIGAALLERSFRTFADRGLTTVALNVDAANETGATALYERVGMRVRHRWSLYLKVLRADPRDRLDDRGVDGGESPSPAS